MPIGVPFKDSAGRRGANQAVKAPLAETSIEARPYSRSIRMHRGNIRCIYKGYGIDLDTSDVIGNKIRLTKTNARRFASWILEVTSRKKNNGSKRPYSQT